MTPLNHRDQLLEDIANGVEHRERRVHGRWEHTKQAERQLDQIHETRDGAEAQLVAVENYVYELAAKLDAVAAELPTTAPCECVARGDRYCTCGAATQGQALIVAAALWRQGERIRAILSAD